MEHEFKWVCAVPLASGCGEGAVWAEAEQALYWTDVTRFLLLRLTPRDGCVKTWLFDEPVVALSLTDRVGRLLVALGSHLILWTAATDERVNYGVWLDGWPQVRFNEGRSGPDGSFWVGSMRNNVNTDGSLREAGGSDGILMRVGPGTQTSIQGSGLGIANTLCWTPDHSRLIFGDTLANMLYIADYRDGVLSNRHPFFTGFERGLPDGSAIDAEGFVWNCRFGGGCIVRISPEGKMDRVIEAPTNNPTTCAFGGPDYRTLYVTSASIHTEPGDRLAGGVFALRTEVPGLPSFAFQY
ncbi:SMP-30/gluconolactonase/LRE family protein [Burkholderia pseudomallei]|uniref:SMP-30/gluconolactonase/LRE family protein n=1 Tax=Burkholderia pseudomallei TaxID=28450 RepID=UPI00014F962D|nr:SMP-30/gluconolactonase/LRE family protein [Burkholderia pseudomallei]AGR68491.1 SMP-30/Gluconolaconase/LRE-like region family protein [Burkholderia pseudomallei MSHR305]AHK67469.1 SMP-30/Gluconolaconase/LRE-like region family protein [Burkholderia pseudomallei MSHR520]AIP83124.1 SMP-30/Gluconolaconase/LRE-like region family protein [Burkholderia pseudomallei]APZ21789.1 gluconolaconase [Burkholderia pseudomallei]APZ27987.1 gluconolaconase [Burkholderia pseudomallei]